MKRKYKLLARVNVNIEAPAEGNSVDRIRVLRGMRRVKALVDIPRYGVKAGDVGGYVSSRHILQHDDDCWIADEAVVWGNVIVMGDALIGGRAYLLGDNSEFRMIVDGKARIDGDATVQTTDEFMNWDNVVGTFHAGDFSALIHENVHIYGNTWIRNFGIISGSAQIFGNSRIINAKYIDGECKIAEDAFLAGGNSVTGNSVILGRTKVGTGTVVQGNSRIGTPGKTLNIPADRKFTDEIVKGQADAILRIQNPKRPVDYSFRKEAKESLNELSDYVKAVERYPRMSVAASKQSSEPNSLSLAEQTISIQTLDDVAARIDSYQKDIVKIIKYPLMVDTTDPYTAKMMMLFNKAQRLREFSSNKKFSEAVDALEEAFLAAESNALKISATALSAGDQKKAAQATDLLQIAMDDAASDNEKQLAFKQGLKQLEGIILVPEEAVEVFRVKAGIAQLTV